ncbi:MAG: PVC-type heme-binding CxxCH protein [Verrucomicrobiota bacterium]
MTSFRCFFVLFFAVVAGVLPAAEPTSSGNRLTYLDGADPFYPHKDFPKLITPQWVGEEGVEAVVILAIDDMRDSRRYEAFLRPILERLKKIDGRAPVSIMVNVVEPNDPQLQVWLKEGLSLDVHTLAHPCPLLQKGSFTNAWNTYHGGVDLLSQVPGNKPVAFRMPCCDSMNSPSPRFYAEIFNRVSPAGNFLSIDSSVMCLLTPKDTTLPRELVLDANGKERFRKYFPTQTNAVTKKSLANFSTWIEDYPYPYVINKVCWEFPAMVPSDWEAFNLHGPTNAVTLADWKAALDAVVLKQGVFTWIFHPHGWSSPAQINDFIDYAVNKHGKKVKFLTFKEALERLNKNLLKGQSLRAANGQDGDVRLLDANNDGFMEVIATNTVEGRKALSAIAPPITGYELGARNGVIFRDMDHDGVCELIVANTKEQAVFAWNESETQWKKLPNAWPKDVAIVNARGEDNGVRFVDINGDGYEDLLYSNEHEYALYLYIAVPKPNLGWEKGWTFKQRGGKRAAAVTAGGWVGTPQASDPAEIPPIVRAGPHRNNGVWFASHHMWIQNEDTAHLPDVVDRRSFKQLLVGNEPPPKSPEESLASMQVRPGFKVELVAAEPLVMDPVAFEWAADGRLWVAEMTDYPLGIPTPDPSQEGNKPGGRIIFLEDANGDGKYDKRTVFLDGLNFPNGVMPWRNGVLVSAAPHILFAEDTNGDGRADVKKVLFSGFVEGNQQHRVNGFQYGLDNWVYAANGDSGGSIKSELTGKTIDIRGLDIRFNPDTGAIETVAGQTQFGRNRDDWGNWFGNNNPTWLWHYHLPIHYLKRNPHLAVKSTRTVTVNYTPPNQVFAIAKLQQRFNWPDRVYQVTSANSASPYRDELFGPDFATSVFASEPANSVVHREVLEPNGVTFSSRRAADEVDREFLASKDNWFRPTMLKTGPDGALYVADMYRLILEHPQYFPEELKTRPDIRDGDDKGRIYRVLPRNAKLRAVPNLAKLNTAQLAAAIDSANGWQRDTAQRLLVERQDKAAVVALKTIAASSTNAKARLQALCALDGLKALTPELLVAAMNDQHAAVREHAARLSEPMLNQNAPLGARLAALANDSEMRVRYQAAFSLGEWKNPEAGQALATLALRDFDHTAMQIAILSSAVPHVGEILSTALAQGQGRALPSGLLEQLIGLAAATGNEPALVKPLQLVARAAGGQYAPWQFEALAGFLDALERRNQSLAKFQNAAGTELKQAVNDLNPVFTQARQVVAEAAAKDEARLAALRLLGRGLSGGDADRQQLGNLLSPQTPPALQQAALDALKRGGGSGVAEILLSRWKTSAPALRNEMLNLLFSRTAWTEALLKAVEAGEIATAEIAVAQRQKLLTHQQGALRERAAKLFAKVAEDRAQIMKQYQGVAELKGDAKKGETLFNVNCATCHRFNNQGFVVGPDLGSMADKSVASLLVAILDPNQAVDAAYTSYTVETKNSLEYVGVIAAETPNSLTLRMAGGAEETVLRNQISTLRSSGLSLMPEGFESALKPQDMADLMAYLLRK